MIKIENVEVVGWEHAIRGMRNPKNSWDRSDTQYNEVEYINEDEYRPEKLNPPIIGENDHDLMMKLAHGGAVHAKYRRMIVVYADITAPLYWLKEYDTYKVGTAANSCSTMHKIHAKEFTLDDFSHEHLMFDTLDKSVKDLAIDGELETSSMGLLQLTCKVLNMYRKAYLETKDKRYWWQLIQLLPSSYNQKRTVMLNYEVLHNMYYSPRYNHKLNEWVEFCEWIKTLPYSEIILTPDAERSEKE